MERFADLFAWLGSQSPLSFLLIGVALYCSAVALALLLQGTRERPAKLCPHDSRRAAGRTLLAQLAKVLAGLITAGWVGSPRAR